MAAHTSRKLAVILHADVVGSTELVQRNESVAHERIQDSFRRFSDTIKAYGGITQEIRGDALVAEFARASDAVTAAIAFQIEDTDSITQLEDQIEPKLRIAWYPISLAWAYLLMDLREDAIATAQMSAKIDRDYPFNYMVLAIAFAELGRKQEANTAIGNLLRIDPGYSLRVFTKTQPFRDVEVLDRHIEGLREAGLPCSIGMSACGYPRTAD